MRLTDTSPYEVSSKSLPVISAIAQSPPSIGSALLHRMNKLTEEFDQIRMSIPDIVPKLIRMYKSKYAYHTIALEGNTLSPGETELVIEQGMTIGGKSLREHLEAKNIPEALEVIIEISKTPKRRLVLADILDIHKLTMKGIEESDPGEFRKGFVGISGTKYLPPPAYELKPLLQTMLDYINSPPKEITHIELAFKAHLWCVYIHPFNDGNGRVARLLTGLILLRYGYPPMIIRNEHRRRYIASIRAVESKSAFKPYYQFMSDEFISTLMAYVLGAKQETSADAVIPLADAARSYGLNPGYLGLRARTGGIPAFKEGKLWYVRQKDIEEYVKKRTRRQLLSES